MLKFRHLLKRYYFHDINHIFRLFVLLRFSIVEHVRFFLANGFGGAEMRYFWEAGGIWIYIVNVSNDIILQVDPWCALCIVIWWQVYPQRWSSFSLVPRICERTCEGIACEIQCLISTFMWRARIVNSAFNSIFGAKFNFVADTHLIYAQIFGCII